MRKILLFDTAIDTGNLGDEIILESVKKELSTILDSASVYRMGTHIENYSPIQMIAHKFIWASSRWHYPMAMEPKLGTLMKL